MTGPEASSAWATRPRVVLTIGKLDGVHAGHRHLAAHVQARADDLGARSAAIVLHPDPVSVLSSERVPRLTTVDERCARLRAFGVEVVEPLRFTREIATLAPEVFLDRLEERFEIAGVVVGPDFAFGQERSGDVSRLDALAAERGFSMDIVSPIEAVGEWISSRRLRGLIHGGDIALARTLLRRPPRVVGTVIHGAARGRELGFPTANLDLTADFVLPANGIYTVRAEWRERRRAPRTSADGVASVGVRPTFDNGARLVEVNLFGFDGDLYGKELTVDFLERQRPEERFDSVTALVAQMEMDAHVARRHHEAETRPRWAPVTDPVAHGDAADAPASYGRDATAATLRGRDLADLCQSAADAMSGATGAGVTGAGVTETGVTGAGATDTGVAGASGTGAGVTRSGWATGGEAGPTARRTVELSADDDASLVEAWLECLTRLADVDGRPQPAVTRASVYQAGAGRLHALVWQTATAGHSAPEVRASLVRLGPGEDGWLEAEVVLPARAPGRNLIDS